MTIEMKEYSASGVDITDELTKCDQPTTGPYFRGNLNYIPNSSVAGSTSTSYGAWTAAAKGGTRYTVLMEGLPEANECVVNIIDGTVTTSGDTDLYLRYVGHGPIKHNINNISVDLPEALEWSTSYSDIRTFKFPFFSKFGYYAIDIYGLPGNANTTFSISNGTDFMNVAIESGVSSFSGDFDNVMKVTKSESLTLSTPDGTGIHGTSVLLLDL